METDKEERLNVGDNCVLISSAVRSRTEPGEFFDHGHVGQIISVFDTFYVVLSYEDANYYYCDHNSVELYLGNI